MLNQFIDEVISKGAEALLPQNLDEKWLDQIYVASKNFLKIAATAEGEIEEDEVLSDENSMMMLSSIVEIAHHQSGYEPTGKPFEIPEDLIFEYISCYSLAIVLECIARQSDITMEKPTLDTIFDRDWLFDVEQKCPEITNLLNKLISGE
ncbi:MAG: hypothetical protein KKD44_16045 [Proteobacteria bacterium]|nr:hypothetical protein [Pseudomonadota bacterium]